MSFKKIGRISLKIVGYLFLFIISYAILGSLISFIPVNRNFEECKQDGVEIYIQADDIHTDLILPIRNEIKDWSAFVNPKDAKAGDSTYTHVAFGWGDKGFYINTPRIEDLKFTTVFKAAFFLSTSAMHVAFKKSIKENETCKKICISKESYKKIISHIESSFQVDGQQKPILIKGAGYTPHDLFYDANGTYNLFYTCNSWANQGLKKAQMKAAFWTLFSFGILHHYK
jgi:uncharacterized protein (TIGR02117 family)